MYSRYENRSTFNNRKGNFWSVFPILIGAIGIAATVGGSMLGIAPSFTLGLFQDLICPGPGQMVYGDIKYSYQDPGMSTPVVQCVALDGSMDTVTFRAIMITLGMMFLISLVLLIAIRALVRRRNRVKFDF